MYWVKVNGAVMGRPPIGQDVIRKTVELRKQHGAEAAARMLGVGVHTVYKRCRQAESQRTSSKPTAERRPAAEPVKEELTEAGCLKAFLACPSTETRNALLAVMLPWIRKTVMQNCRGVPRHGDRDSILSDVMLRLVSALERFDPCKAELRTFVANEIKWGVRDSIRSHVGRKTQQQRKEWNTARAKLERKLRRGVSDSEVMDELGWTECDRRRAFSRQTVSIHTRIAAGDETPELEQLLGRLDDQAPLETEQALTRLTGGLSLVEKVVVYLRFQPGLSMAEIGRLLALCESRVSQIVARAKQQLEQETA